MPGVTTTLLLACVVNLQCLHILATTVLVPFKGMMILVRDLNDFADGHLHSRNRFNFTVISEGFGCRIVGAFGIHDSSAHVINPGRNEFLLYVVVAFERHALKREILDLAIG